MQCFGTHICINNYFHHKTALTAMTNTYAFVTNNEMAMTENFKPEINKLKVHKHCPVSGMSSPYR